MERACTLCDKWVNILSGDDDASFIWCRSCFAKHRHLIADLIFDRWDDRMIEAYGYTYIHATGPAREDRLMQRVLTFVCNQCGRIH